VNPETMVDMAEQEVFRRTRQSPVPGGEQPFEDYAVDAEWYDRHEVDGGRVSLTRFGSIPAPSTLSGFIRTVQQIAQAANGQIDGWRGQSRDWAVHSGAMRRVMRPWVKPFPTDSQRNRELIIKAVREPLGVKEAGRDNTRRRRPATVVGHADLPQVSPQRSAIEGV
jgi:hypothetical protein